MNLLDILRRQGVDVIPEQQWESRERPGTFVPVGVMWHHTAAGGDKEFPSLTICRDGRPGISGPLCNLLGGRGTGRMILLGDGKANDSGMGSSVVLKDVQRDIAPTGTAASRGLSDDINGNPYFYDIELENNGVGEQWAPELIEAGLRATLALCIYHGWGPNRVIAHKEWTRRKIDPTGVNMDVVRAEIKNRLQVPVPTPPSNEDPIMNLPTLQRGSTGSYVKNFQGLLSGHAQDLAMWFSGNDIDKWQDGTFGQNTEYVLMEWQKRTGKLTPDGVCGPSTWAWLIG